MRWVGHLASMGERRSAYRVLVGKPEGMRPPGRPRNKWEDKYQYGSSISGIVGSMDWTGQLNQEK